MRKSDASMSADIVASRAENYDYHYRTAGWKAQPWTKAKAENYFAYALDVERGGSLRGKEIQHALGILGAPNLSGMRVLDYCCGAGITSAYFALCGAEVWAFDASRTAVDIGAKSAEMSGVSDVTHFAVLDARSLPYEDDFFDAAFCQSALHIVIDYPECPGELYRVLKHGSTVVFCEEALAYNPLLRPIRWVRRRRWVKCGGRPLSYPDIDRFGVPFSRTQIRHFNLLAQAKTAFDRQLSRHGSLKPWTRVFLEAMERVDAAVLSALPFLKRYCGQVVVSYTK